MDTLGKIFAISAKGDNFWDFRFALFFAARHSSSVKGSTLLGKKLLSEQTSFQMEKKSI